MQPRTKRQREILDYLTTFIAEQGYEPSYQHIARRFKIASKSAIAKHVAALERQGFLVRSRIAGSFNLQIVTAESRQSDSTVQIPWLETGEAEGLFDETWQKFPISVPRFMLGIYSAERMRAYRVRNDSMLKAQIVEGDVALVEQRSFARDGDIVVAATKKEKSVLMRFYRRGSEIELRPANDEFSVIKSPADKISVFGVYRSLLRPVD